MVAYKLTPHQLYIRTLSLKYSSKQLSKKFKVSSSTISRWKLGKSIPQKNKRDKIFRAFAVFNKKNVVTGSYSVSVDIVDSYGEGKSYVLNTPEMRVHLLDKRIIEEINNFSERYGDWDIVAMSKPRLQLKSYGAV